MDINANISANWQDVTVMHPVAQELSVIPVGIDIISIILAEIGIALLVKGVKETNGSLGNNNTCLMCPTFMLFLPCLMN